MGWPPIETCTFTVEVNRDQAERWRDAAHLEERSVESWLAHTANTYLKELVRTGRSRSLSWNSASFEVLLSSQAHKVQGLISGPFGIFRGSAWGGVGEPGCGLYTLVHLPTGRVMKTLGLQKACMALAAELSVLKVNWKETDPETILVGAPDQKKVQELVRFFDKLA